MTTERPEPCYREPTNGVHFTRNTHRHDCAEPDCRGCKPCPGRHCTARTNCTWHIDAADLTCGRCIAEARRELRWIGDLSALMPTQAVMDGIDSEAAYLAANATDPRSLTTWQVARKNHLRVWESLGRITEEQHAHAVAVMSEDDEHHPYSVLTRWQMMIAEDCGHELPARLSIQGAAAYLDRHLRRIANDDTQDFPLLRRELRKCRQHLEAVLHNDTRPDQGAPCPTCVQETGKGRPLRREYSHWCDDADCERFHLTDDASDVWRCARNRDHWWTAQGYADVVREMWEDAERERMGA